MLARLSGLGQVIDGTAPAPALDLTALFPGLSQVSLSEWIVIGVVGAMVVNSLLTVGRGVGRATGAYRGYRKRQQRRRELETEYRGLGWF